MGKNAWCFYLLLKTIISLVLCIRAIRIIGRLWHRLRLIYCAAYVNECFIYFCWNHFHYSRTFTVLTYLPVWSKIETKFSEQNVYGCSTLNRISSELYRNECITALLSIGKWFYKKPSDAQQDEGWKIRLNRIYMNVFSSALHAICRVYSRSIKIQLGIFCYVFSSNYILYFLFLCKNITNLFILFPLKFVCKLNLIANIVFFVYFWWCIIYAKLLHV